MANRTTRRRTAVSLADVARAAEVSTATVSNALNGTGRLAPATRRRVHAIATALGYPARPARHPPPGRFGALALATGDGPGAAWVFNQDSHLARVLATATTVAHARGFALLALPSHPQSWRPLAVDGALLLESPPGDRLPGELRGRGLPFLFLGRPSNGPAAGGAWVDNDHDTGTRSVLDHLAAVGGRRVAVLAGDSAEHYTKQCARTYLDWCAERGQAPVIELAAADDFHGHRSADRLLARAEPPDAVYGIYDHLGRVLLDAAHRRGLRVPTEVMIACASDSTRYAATDPPITTLGLDPDAVARLAVEMLVDVVVGAVEATSCRVVPTVLHPRASTAAVGSVRSAS